MTAPSLTPALALAYLRELSLDVRSAVVLDAENAVLAGDSDLASRARALLDGAEAGENVARTEGGATLAVRAPNGLAIVVVAGPLALEPLLLHDLRTVLADLDPVVDATGSSDSPS